MESSGSVDKLLNKNRVSPANKEMNLHGSQQ